MPELPEVETVRKGLNNLLDSFFIQKLEVNNKRVIASDGGSEKFTEMLIGSTVGSWNRRGKYLFASLQKQLGIDSKGEIIFQNIGWWGVHLRMTGQFHWLKKPKAPCKHTRVRLWNKYGEELRFIDTRNFGQMWWVPPDKSVEEGISGIKKLGPEPFSKAFNEKYLKSKLIKSNRKIKSLLLDQSIIAGIGNIYADESLFLAGIIPHKKSNQVNDIEITKLCKSIIHVLKISIRKGGTTFSDFRDLSGASGSYGEEAFVYQRANKTCKVCNFRIKREKINGRGTHWCPNCQT